MRFCLPHWEALKDAIKQRGLYTLVAEDGQEVATKMMRQAQDGLSIDTFEPLLGAHNAIVGNALSIVGLEIFKPNEDGSPRCPLCFLRDDHALGCRDPNCDIKDFDDWINRAADGQLKIWQGLGNG